MRSVFYFIACLVVLAVSASAEDLERSVKVDGVTRDFIVHLPPKAKRGKPLPLLIALHGGGGLARHFAEFSGFDAIADRLARAGGGTISIFYHPCEWSSPEFWDGVNFARGANPPRDEWQPSPLHPPEVTAARLRWFEASLAHVLQHDDLADGVLPGPEAIGEGLVYRHDRRGCPVILLRKVPAS